MHAEHVKISLVQTAYSLWELATSAKPTGPQQPLHLDLPIKNDTKAEEICDARKK